jgi:predicted TIM-barrel fold metal-dependent hydrolase
MRSSLAPGAPTDWNAFYHREMEELDHPVFDCDNHYYEALDAFTRHLDPALGPRCVQWCEIDGRRYHVVGGRVSRAVTNPTFDPIAKPGAMYDYFRGNPEGRNPLEFLRDREPIRSAYRDRDARLVTLDEQGLAGCWLFPTLGMLYEETLKDDPEAVCSTFRAFNRWLDEDWGFAYRDRIFAGPYLSLADVDWAVDELEWALDRGARTIVMRPAAPTTATGRHSPFDPRFDPFWSRVNEAGVTVVLHAGDSGRASNGYAADGFAATFQGGWKPSIKMFDIERAIFEFLISMMFDNFFVRFPNLRIASVENGAEFLPELFGKLRSVDRRMPGYFPGDPVEAFRRQVWINPFWEDDVNQVVDCMGADRVIFGSDWPHIEGMPEPLDYVRELKDFTPDDRRRILYDNVMELTILRSA